MRFSVPQRDIYNGKKTISFEEYKAVMQYLGIDEEENKWLSVTK